MASTTTKRASSAWADLPPDLLGLVLRRLHSLADRARVGAVCRPWRSGARLHRDNLPPAMPWVALGGAAYVDVVNGDAARRLSLCVPEKARCRGSDGHLLFLTRAATGACFLADPFSGAVLPVADLASFIKELTRGEMFSRSFSLSLSVRVLKVVLLWPPRHGSSSVPVVAAMVKNRASQYNTTVFVCRAGTDTGVGNESYGAMAVDLPLVKDVAFFRGDLYALSTRDELLAVRLGEGPRGNPAITTAVESGIEVPDDGECRSHAHDGIRPASDVRLVQSGDQLLMLRRWVIDDGGDSTSVFDVYEADFGASRCRWKPVSGLRGRALFLGRCCSKSVPVGDGHFGAEEDCIYFVRHAGDSGIYDMEYCRVRPLVPDTKVLRRHGRSWNPTWVFPDQSIIEAHYYLMKESLAQGARVEKIAIFCFGYPNDPNMCTTCP